MRVYIRVCKKLFLLLSAISFVGCSPKVEVNGEGAAQAPGRENKTEFSAQPASGAVNGVSWSFKSGAAKVESYKPGRLSISLYNEAFADPCSWLNVPTASILTSAPIPLGEVTFGSGNPIQTATFSYRDQNGGANLIATEGRMQLTQVDEHEVTGFIIATYDNANYVNGSFKLTMCPE